MVGDRDLLAFRCQYYSLLVALLWREPAGEVLARLGEGIAGRAAAAAALEPRLAEGWQRVAAYLASARPGELAERVAEEYTRLFLGPPYPELNLYESYYLTGHVYDRPLAVLRATLAELGLAKDPAYAEPEDFVAFELDVVRQLAERQGQAADPDDEVRWVNAQASFLKRHLLVWGPAAARDLATSSSAEFYAGVGRLLEGFLALERSWFVGWGTEPVRSLEEARAQFAGSAEWKGPLFEPPGGESPGPGEGRTTAR
jgi:TorA maturation chaperone TorD